MEKNGIIVISGGVDSVTLLYDRQEEIALALTFRYGSNHQEKEVPCAVYHCQQLGIPHQVIDLDFIRNMHSSLLEGANAIPTEAYDEENMKSTVVPFRNGVMLAIATAFAEDRGLSKVFIANHFGDHAIYPDCTSSFVQGMNDAMREGTYNKVEIVAPYTNKSKAEIVALGLALGVPYHKTWSCYKGEALPCGICATCRERIEAFAQNGINDPLEYPNL